MSGMVKRIGKIDRGFANLIDNLLDDRWLETNGPGIAYPKVDIYDKGDAVAIEAEIPGMPRDQIEVFVEDNRLFIRGCRTRQVFESPEEKEPENGQKGTPVRTERTMGSFSRTFILNEGLDPANISGRHENGVLYLVIPKVVPAKPERKTIMIEE